MTIIDKQFFDKHQKKILWVINTRLGRWLLGIEKMGHQIGNKKIDRITPNSIRTYENGKYTEQFFVKNDYAIKLSKILSWMPVVSMVDANERQWILRPAYQLAMITILGYFSIKTGLPLFLGTTDTFNPAAGASSPVDGLLYARGSFTVSASTWAYIRGGGRQVDIHVDWTEHNLYIGCYTGTNDRFSDLMRAMELFDTSSLTSSADISSSTLSIYGTGKSKYSSISPGVNIYQATPGATDNLSSSDWSQFGSTEFSTTISYASYNGAGYNDFALNASGISNISKTGVSKFGVMEANYDAPNSAPPWESGGVVNFPFKAADSASNKPKLVITYTISSPTNTSNFFF